MSALRAFIAEDNPAIRASLADTLRDMARVEMAGMADSDVETIDWLQAHSGEWDLAVVDLFLKGGTGLQVLEACRHRSPHQSVVVLSNHTTPDVRSRCKQLGADAVFDKVSEIDDLVDFCLRLRAGR